MAAAANDDASPAGTARAMERVLRAEREAEVQLAQARQQAQARVEAAREQALARVNRSLERIARWQRGHQQALATRLAVLQAQSEAALQARPVADAAQIAAAAEQVAARITGAGESEGA